MKDNLLTEVKKVLVGVNTIGFDFASKYGLIVEVIGKDEFDTLAGVNYTPPDENPQDKALFDKGAQRLWHNYMAACYTRSGSIEAICENIRDALPERYYEQLEDEIMGYKEVKIIDYFDHLDNKWCKMDTRTRQKMRKEFYQPWDQVMHLTKFGIQLNKEQTYLGTCGIKITDDVKAQFYVKQMIDSGIFSKVDIIAWESDLQDKEWADAVLFFEARMEDEDKYTEVLGGLEKRTRFESAQTINERQAAQEE